ncbi:MAG: transposase [Deltaproteobacteria bacterium]|nr:transposase [Deltaproteobacteria bacterium]
MDAKDFFLSPNSIKQKQYEALRMYHVEGKSAKEVADKFGYKHRGFTTIVTEFNKKLNNNEAEDLFFKPVVKGRKTTKKVADAQNIIISLRKKYHSVEEIKVILDGKNLDISEKTIYNIINQEGFSRLPRRTKLVKQELKLPKIQATKSCQLSFKPEKFKSTSAGILCLLPYINKYGIFDAILQSDYPETKTIDKQSSILSFIALKASCVKRYSSDDRWCMDRGLGLFAGLNVLPKAAWFTSYSHRVTTEMNLNFLKSLQKVWSENGLLGDTANLDFTTIPYWGDDEHLENNWAGKRGKAMPSILAILAHDPDTGIINYGNTNVMHKRESDEVLEFLDFYKTETSSKSNNLRYIVFDSKFTNYQNLRRLNDDSVKFITIRRRGKNIVDRIDKTPAKERKAIRVEMAGNKKRSLKVLDEQVYLKGYDGVIRQICITGHGKIKPAIIITNDFDLPVEQIVRKYSKRWIVEKAISEQIDFFHLNLVSSSMVIKVDFDLTMSILTHNLFRLFALDLERYSHLSDQSLFDKFLLNSADVEIESNKIKVNLKKKRNLPAILEATEKYSSNNYQWINNLNVEFCGATYS